MKKWLSLLLPIPFFVSAQVYEPKAQSNDSFSKAFVELLNHAKNDFTNCTGEMFQVSHLSEPEFYSTLKLPGSVANIVRERDPGYFEAYYEFGGYKNSREVYAGMLELIGKIKNALGDQLEPVSFNADPDSMRYFIVGLQLRNKAGFFQQNIELFAGSDSHEPYLQKPAKEYFDKATHNKERSYHFILLKVIEGVPDYYYKIPGGLVSADKIFHDKISSIVSDAKNDFAGLMRKAQKNNRFTDSNFLKNAVLQYVTNAQNPFCEITINLETDSSLAAFYQYHNELKAVLGSRYVYKMEESNTSQSSYWQRAIYFARPYNIDLPTVFLERRELEDDKYVIAVTIQSQNTKRVKRVLTSDDFD